MRVLVILAVIQFCGSQRFLPTKWERWPYQISDLMTDEDLLEWEAPRLLSDNYNYYQTGYDFQGRPVWVLEWGRWDIHKIVEKNYKDSFERYNRQMYARIAKSIADGASEESVYHRNLTTIIDAAGFDLDLFTSSETLDYILRLFRIFRPQMEHLSDKTYVVNAHFLMENLMLYLRPILGDILKPVKIYGTQKNKWLPVLQYNIPENAVPDL